MNTYRLYDQPVPILGMCIYLCKKTCRREERIYSNIIYKCPTLRDYPNIHQQIKCNAFKQLRNKQQVNKHTSTAYNSMG